MDKTHGQEGLLKAMERSLLLVNRCHIREMNYLRQYRWRKFSINNKQLANNYSYELIPTLPSGIPTKIQGDGKNGKRAHKSSPEEEVWEQEELLSVLIGLGRHLRLLL